MFDKETGHQKLAELEQQIAHTEQKIRDHASPFHAMQTDPIHSDKERELLNLMHETLDLLKDHYQQVQIYIGMMEDVAPA